MAIAVTGSTVDGGRTSETPRLDTTTDMAAVFTDISNVSAKLETSLKIQGTSMVALGAMFKTARNSGMMSMMAEDSVVASMTAEDYGMAAML